MKSGLVCKRLLPLTEDTDEGSVRSRTRGNNKSACQIPLIALFAVLSLTVSAAITFAQSSSFTYQGRLTDGGTAANGNYDLQFALFDSLSGGGQVGSTQTLNTVAVSNGVFTVSLDFGANAFPGANRFLEIRARAAGAPSFTTLTPRQPITSTPYAVRSLNAASADSVPASGVSAGSGNYIQNSSSSQTANFNISGNGTAGGTLTGNVVNATTQYNLAGFRILSRGGGPANLFLGFLAGEAMISGGGGSANTIVGQQAGQQTTGRNNAFFGFAAGIGDMSGFANTAIGSAADVGSGNLSNATAIGACARVTQSDSLILGSTRDGRSFCNGELLRETNVGIGTTAPTAKLSVIATGDGARILHLGTERSWVFKQFGTGAETALELTGNDPNNNNKNFLVTTTGFVGIGTTAPNATLSVNGSASKPGGGSWATFSDERLKTVKGRFTSGLKAVMQLQPLRYEYKRDNALKLKSEGEQVGFSAQAVQKIIPEAVTSTGQGYLLVNNDPILWTMLNAIKEQQAQIEKLQQANSALTARLKKVEKARRNNSFTSRRR